MQSWVARGSVTGLNLRLSPPPLDRPLHALHTEKSCARHSVVLLVKGEYIR